MASAALRAELDCSICLSTYTDPVMLRCGHNFCRVCIDHVLDTQDQSGVYSCPECREEFQDRPVLMRCLALRNIMENLLSTQPTQTETGIFCTYCVDSPVPAVKSCLLCEASLCDKHLKVHSKGPEHVLSDPSTDLETRKCSVHKKVLKYYCTVDSTCICVSCSLIGEHNGHKTESLHEASKEKKKKLKNVLQKLTTKMEETEERVRSLEASRRKAQEKLAGEAERVTALSDVIQKLEIKKAELSMKMRHIEELCNMTDPLTVLQDPDTGDLCDPEEGGGDEDTVGHDRPRHDVDVDGITGMLHAGFSDIVTYLQTISPVKPKEMRPQPPSVRSQDLPESGTKYGDNEVRTGGFGVKLMTMGIYGQGPADILLDVNTSANNIRISDDLKTATRIQVKQNRPETAERFEDCQVISSSIFTSGRHYWDVDVSRSRGWIMGMCYPSIDRKGYQSYIGDNNKSWSLLRTLKNQYVVIHDMKEILLRNNASSSKLRICLNYEAGQLSFYELCDPVRHLHTFTATFTEPLHSAIWVGEGSIKILGGGSN